MMKSLIILCVVMSVALAQGPVKITTPMEMFNTYEPSDLEGRIINGKPAAVGQFPWQAALSIQKNGASYVCGGSLIGPQWVLTAAHCVEGAISVTVRLGGLKYSGAESTVQTFTSRNAFPHERYNAQSLSNDVGLIRLPSDAQINQYVQVVKLATTNYLIGAGAVVTVSGWGKTRDNGSVSPTLNYVSLKTISNQACKNVFGDIVISSTLCAEGNPNGSSCQGDSGGPLVQYKNGVAVHVGVVSFTASNGCALGYPTGYARTSSFAAWIKSKTGI